MNPDVHFGKTYKQILKLINQEKGLLFLVIDPQDQSPKESGKLAQVAAESGVNAVAVGGSLGAQGDLLDNTIIEVKEKSKLPVILFPGNIATISKYADAIYFMSMMNSRDPYYLSGAQIAASYPIMKLGLEAIPTSYIVFEPGRAVGWVGDAKLIPREIPYLAALTALAGHQMGHHLCILESGSGAPSPVPPSVISTVRKVIDTPIIIAGGVRNEKFAYESIKAGADILHVGNAAKVCNGNYASCGKLLSKISASIKKAGKEK